MLFSICKIYSCYYLIRGNSRMTFAMSWQLTSRDNNFVFLSFFLYCYLNEKKNMVLKQREENNNLLNTCYNMSGIELSFLYTPLHLVLWGFGEGCTILKGDRNFSTLFCLASNYLVLQPGSLWTGDTNSQASDFSMLLTSFSKISPWTSSLTVLYNW